MAGPVRQSGGPGFALLVASRRASAASPVSTCRRGMTNAVSRLIVIDGLANNRAERGNGSGQGGGTHELLEHLADPDLLLLADEAVVCVVVVVVWPIHLEVRVVDLVAEADHPRAAAADDRSESSPAGRRRRQPERMAEGRLDLERAGRRARHVGRARTSRVGG